jgi:hypothetical protein
VPTYQFNPYQQNNPVILIPTAGVPGPPGPPAYAFGSKSLSVPSTRMLVTQSAVSSNVVTLTVKVVEGNIPLVNQTIFVYATANNSGAFNTSTGATITAVNITASTGVGTVSYAVTTANLTATADVGYAIVPVVEVSEALSVKKSQQFALSGYGVSWAYTCPSAPSTISIQLEGAINDSDSEYTIIGSAQTATSGYTEVFATLPENVNFVRLNITATTGGTSPTIIAKIQVTRS